MAKKIGTIVDEITKDFGKEILIPADSLIESSGKIIPTTLSLDVALSGGIIEGSVTNLSGLPKAGKTTLALTIMANAQKTFKKKCFYIDVEGRLRPELLKTIKDLVWTKEQEDATGIPRLQIVKSSQDKFLTAEDYINIMDRLFKSEKGCVIVLDSIAALCTDAAFSAQAGESTRMMGVPRLMYDFLRKQAQVVPVMNSNLITITHLQADPSRYGSGKAEVGGNAIQYFASNRLVCMSVQRVPKDSIPQIGQDAKFKCTSSALGPPAGEAIIYIRYGRGCDQEEDIVATAEELGFVNKAGAWYNFQLESMEEEVKVQGKQRLVDYLKENTNIRNELEKSIRDLLFGDQVE